MCGAVHAFAYVPAAWIRLRRSGLDSVLVGILALVPAQEHESHAHELEAFRVDVTETVLIGGEGIHVFHQLEPLVLQVFQQFVHQNSPVSNCCSEPPWFCGCAWSVTAVTASTGTPNKAAISCGGLPNAFNWLTFIGSTCCWPSCTC